MNQGTDGTTNRIVLSSFRSLDERLRLFGLLKELHARFVRNNTNSGIESFVTYLQDEIVDSKIQFCRPDGADLNTAIIVPSSRTIQNFLSLYDTDRRIDHDVKMFWWISAAVHSSTGNFHHVVKATQSDNSIASDLKILAESLYSVFLKSIPPEMASAMQNCSRKLEGYYTEYDPSKDPRRIPGYIIGFRKFGEFPLCRCTIINAGPDWRAFLDPHWKHTRIVKHEGIAIPTIQASKGLYFTVILLGVTGQRTLEGLRVVPGIKANYESRYQKWLNDRESRAQMGNIRGLLTTIPTLDDSPAVLTGLDKSLMFKSLDEINRYCFDSVRVDAYDEDAKEFEFYDMIAKEEAFEIFCKGQDILSDENFSYINWESFVAGRDRLARRDNIYDLSKMFW